MALWNDRRTPPGHLTDTVTGKVQKPAGSAFAAQEAFKQGGDTRMLKRQLAKGNTYAHAKLARRGLAYKDGMIVRP